MKARHTLAMAGLAAVLLLSSGCALFLVGAGAAIGAGTIAYAQGKLQAADNVTFDRAWSATTLAMVELKLKVINSSRDELSGRVLARDAMDQRITVSLRKQTDQVTEFQIRVGTIGDEAFSRQIYEKIKSHF